MQLTNVQIKVFKSIEDSGKVVIDPSVTALVGQNESGKTAFLQTLHKANSIEPGVNYSIWKSMSRYPG
jgi:predicted ATP-dependent endonuclease of OLD family